MGFCWLVGFCLFWFVVFSFKRAWTVPKYDTVLLLSCTERQKLKRSVEKPAHWMCYTESGFYFVSVSEYTSYLFHLHSRQELWGGVSDRAITAGSTSVLMHQNCKNIFFPVTCSHTLLAETSQGKRIISVIHLFCQVIILYSVLYLQKSKQNEYISEFYLRTY